MHDLRRVLTSTWLLGALVALFAWPNHIVVPAAGIDPAWQLSLQMAAHRGLDFGTQVVINGGPLEFVLHPTVAYTWTAIVGGIYLLAVQLALGLTLVWTLRRSLPLLLAVPLSYLVLVLDADQFVPAPVPILVLAVIWSLVALDENRPDFALPLLTVGGGIVSAIALLVQFSEGFMVLFICATTVLVQPLARRHSATVFFSVFVCTLVPLWFATGQGVGNADDYVRTAFEVVSGWSVALPYDAPAASWAKLFAAAAIAGTFLAVALGTGSWPRLQRAAAFAIVAAFDFSAWKHGFVIDLGIYTALFAFLMLVPWLGFRWSGARLGVAVLAIVALSAFFFPVSGYQASGLTRPLARAEDAVSQLETLFLPGPRTRARDGARRALRDLYRIDARTLAMLRGRSVFTYPWEVAPAWAYELDWHPQPVLPFLAYTPELDRLDANAISSSSGPEAILRHRPCGAYLTPQPGCEPWLAVGPTFLPHEEPLATIAILCNFEAVRTVWRWQVLHRVPDRCGPARKIATQTVAQGETVRIPAPPRSDEMVLARVRGLAPDGLERLRTFLYRATLRYESLDGLTYRVVPGTMEDGVLLRVPRTLDFDPPLPMLPRIHTVSFVTDSGFGAASGPYEIEYLAIPVRPRLTERANRPEEEDRLQR